MTSFCYKESKQAELIESDWDKRELFSFLIFDPDRGSKASQNLQFLSSRDTPFSWFGVYSFEPGFHDGFPCSATHGLLERATCSLLAATLAGSTNATAKLECKYVPLSGSVGE